MSIFNMITLLLETMETVSYLSPKDTHGPIVKTGPTAGQNRSRNKNGRWRKKRSDAKMPH